eukprot:Polyplicarium_translucidae@DN1957_c0_g1_i1.p2
MYPQSPGWFRSPSRGAEGDAGSHPISSIRVGAKQPLLSGAKGPASPPNNYTIAMQPALPPVSLQAAHAPPPPRQPQKSPKRTGLCFLIGVCHFIAFQYFGYVLILLQPLFIPNITWTGVTLALTLHVLFALLLASFVQCIVTDAGMIPANWGFYMGDDTKRRRYCKECNVWKPDRAHHCSACRRCVLHMDHHCPWINNCVGFYNRKFFLQLLIYALLALTLVAVHGCVFAFQQGFLIWKPDESAADRAVGIFCYCVVCVMLFFALTLIFALVPFTRFHFALVLRNSTTIENMDRTINAGRYDLGGRRNLEQVLGPTTSLWWWPAHTPASRPSGDGVRWRQHYLRAADDEV